MEHTQLPLEVVLSEDEDSASVALISDTSTEELDQILLGTIDESAFSKLIPEPSRTPVSFAGDDPETFDAEDDIITSVETPEVPPFAEPAAPGRVERAQLGPELRKAAKTPKQLKAWIRSMLAQGHTISELVKHAEKSDSVVARHIQDSYDALNEAEPE